MDTSAPLVWNDSLMTGVPDIDEQHRILVHSLTEARAKLADETSPDVLEAITQDLLAYALYHFETEEALMHETGYTAAAGADARQHLAEHRDFSAQVVAMRSTQGGHPRRAGCVAGLSQQLAGEAHHAHRQAVCGLHAGPRRPLIRPDASAGAAGPAAPHAPSPSSVSPAGSGTLLVRKPRISPLGTTFVWMFR
jgi:hemerythrin